MKTVYVHAKSNVDCKLTEEALKEVPEGVGIVSNIQHLHKLDDVQAQIKNSKVLGQVLGCRADVADHVKKDYDNFLYVGTGVFHPVKVALVTKKPVYIWNPVNKKLKTVDDETLLKYDRISKVSLSKFFAADIVGVLVTTKPGQVLGRIAKPTPNAWKNTLDMLRKKFPEKKFVPFAFDHLDVNNLEDFNFVQCWLNLACSRIADEKPFIANLHEILEFS